MFMMNPIMQWHFGIVCLFSHYSFKLLNQCAVLFSVDSVQMVLFI